MTSFKTFKSHLTTAHFLSAGKQDQTLTDSTVYFSVKREVLYLARPVRNVTPDVCVFLPFSFVSILSTNIFLPLRYAAQVAMGGK